MKYILLIIICFGNNIISAQSSIQINEDPAITRLMDHYLKVNKSITHVSGWRVTIMTTNDRRQVEEAKANFQKNFNYKSKWEYKEPYYHLKAGAFLSRNEAAWALEQIKKKFPSAFLSADKIPYDEF